MIDYTTSANKTDARTVWDQDSPEYRNIGSGSPEVKCVADRSDSGELAIVNRTSLSIGALGRATTAETDCETCTDEPIDKIRET